ncbi:MAG: class I SAM-dependent methyltransferase [Patescibacteria group bacterium]
MDNLYLQEKEKYSNAWKNGSEGQSRTAYYVYNYLKSKLNKEDKILDLGCGSGLIVELLRQNNFNNVFGVDLTLEGLKQYNPKIKFNQPIPEFTPKLETYFEAPLWELPFPDNCFDFSYSCDVLEHLPPSMLEPAIKEILRVTRLKTYHCIATFADKRDGFDFHLSIHEINIWREKFTKLNNKNIEIEIIDRTEFLRQVNPEFKGK